MRLKIRENLGAACLDSKFTGSYKKKEERMSVFLLFFLYRFNELYIFDYL